MRKDLEQACHLSLRLLKAHAQYAILKEASFNATGYVLMIEDYSTDQSGKTYKTYVPVSFGSKTFTPKYLKLSIYAKEFLAVHFAFDTLALSSGAVQNLHLSLPITSASPDSSGQKLSHQAVGLV